MNPTRLSRPQATAAALSFLSILSSPALNLHMLRAKGCTPPIFRILCYVRFHSGATMTDIAKAFKRSPAAIHGISLQAEKRGYLSRIKADGDNKRIPLLLTKKADKLLDGVMANIARFLMEHTPNA